MVESSAGRRWCAARLALRKRFVGMLARWADPLWHIAKLRTINSARKWECIDIVAVLGLKGADIPQRL
jgi:hypothetical protein